MKSKYPKYRVSQWIDTSHESMSKEEADIWYGVQAKAFPYGRWMHVHAGGKPVLFREATMAHQKCDELNSNTKAP